MWNEIVEYQSLFQSAVLVSVDSDGYPVSIRTSPQPDPVTQVLLLDVPAGIGIQPGPAALLWHSHDERLATLKSFAVRGRLKFNGIIWFLQPTHFLPGVGVTGNTHFVAEASATATAYLEKRGLERPIIPWENFEALKQKEGADILIQKEKIKYGH